MKNTTIKAVMNIDYVVYFDKDMKLIEYKISEDNINAVQLRYHTEDDCGIDNTSPAEAFYLLEVFGVATTLAFTIKEDNKMGELLIYRPASMEMAREIGKTIGTAIPLNKEDKAKSPAVLIPMDSDRLKDILDRVPYPNWMEECWGTPAWIRIWNTKPVLQTVMLEFSTAKHRRRERRKENCVYLKEGICIINKGVSCTFETCTEFEVK